MKYSELKDKTREELLAILKDLKGGLSRLSFELSNNTLKNSSQIKKNKKDIARIMTVLRNVSSYENTSRHSKINSSL